MLLDDPNVPESISEHLFVIRKNATIEARLIEDLIDVAKLEKGKLDLNLRDTNVHDVLRTAIEICTPDLETKRLRFIRRSTGSESSTPCRFRSFATGILESAKRTRSSIRRRTVGWH
jgi:signal transduction histidine kinase